MLLCPCDGVKGSVSGHYLKVMTVASYLAFVDMNQE